MADATSVSFPAPPFHSAHGVRWRAAGLLVTVGLVEVCMKRQQGKVIFVRRTFDV
jgi:hypothetical protein